MLKIRMPIFDSFKHKPHNIYYVINCLFVELGFAPVGKSLFSA